MARGGGAMDPQVTGKSDQPQTNFWCRWIVNRTGLMFGIFLSLHLFAVALTGILLWTGYPILPLVFDGLPLAMNNEVMYLRTQAWAQRREDLQPDEDRRKRSVDSSGLISTFENTLQEIHEGGEVRLNLQEDLEKQLWGSSPAMAAEKLLSARLKAKEGYAEEVPKFLRDDMSRFLEEKPFFPRSEECCDMSKSLSGFKMDRERCWCNPHGSHQAGQGDQQQYPSYYRVKRDTEEIDYLDERRKTLTSINLIYEDPNGNVFTKENLRKIAKFEYALYQAEDFKTQYCKTFKLLGALHCQPFSSILRFFDGTYSYEDDKLFDPSFTDIPGVLNKANSIESMSDILTFHLAKDAVLNSTLNIATSRRTRSMVFYGYPYAKYLNSSDVTNRRTQQLTWRKWARADLKPLLVSYYEGGVGGLDFYYVSMSLYWSEAIESVTADLLWLMAAFGFIYLFMFFQTGSLWVTSFGMISILTTFFAANLLYNVLIGYKYFGIFNVLALFIVLGIGADDIFIFSDTWKLYASCQFGSLEERLSIVFKRAALAMFVTSLTTMVAFFVSSFSPLLPISAFGTYAGLCIFINYLSVISFFPCVIIMYHRYFEKYSCCCCCVRKTMSTHSEKPPMPSTPGSEDPRPPSRSSIASVEAVERSTTNLQGDTKSMPPSDRLNAILVKFFRNQFFRFVTNKYVRVIILILFLAFMGLCLYSALQVKMDNSTLKIFDSYSMEEKSNAKNTYDFKATLDEPTMDVLVVWGLGPQDSSACKPLEYNPADLCEGKTRWIEEFSLEDEASQTALVNWCKKIRTGLDSSVRDSLQLVYSSTTQETSIDCFIEDMDNFYKTEHLQPQYPANISLALPITLDKMKTIMTYNPLVYNPATINDLTRPFEMALNFWLTHRYTNDTIPDNRNKFSSYLGLRKLKTTDFSAQTEEEEPSFFDEIKEKKTLYEARLMYAAVQIATTVPTERVTLTEAIPLQASWENFINTELDAMPPTLQHGFQQTRLWVWINILDNLSTQSFSAFGIGLCLAFLVIFLGTQNIITGFVATLMLACVTCAVIAVIPVAGWKFGLLEGLNFCLIVGLAVDYIVHLAEGYHMSSFTGRLDRVRDTLERVGISILSGAITTLGASFFMLFARILFFKQFGIFMFCTIGCSMIFALFVMLAAYSIFGPEGYFASFVPLCRDKGKYREHKEQAVAHENAAYEAEAKSTPM